MKSILVKIRAKLDQILDKWLEDLIMRAEEVAKRQTRL